MQGLLLINDIVGMLVSVLVMLIIIQFVIGLLFAFNVVNPSNQWLMKSGILIYAIFTICQPTFQETSF